MKVTAEIQLRKHIFISHYCTNKKENCRFLVADGANNPRCLIFNVQLVIVNGIYPFKTTSCVIKCKKCIDMCLDAN